MRLLVLTAGQDTFAFFFEAAENALRSAEVGVLGKITRIVLLYTTTSSART